MLLLLFTMTRKERFCEGTLAHYFDDGSVRRWIRRLKDIDDGVESVPPSESQIKEEKIPAGFKGTLQKIRLISNNICFGLEPMPDDEVEQRLSVISSGGIWLTRYRYGGIDDRPKLLRKEKLSADENIIKNILEAVARNFEKYDDVMATDVGVWSIDLTNTDGETFQINGSLIPDSCHGLIDFIITNTNPIIGVLLYSGWLAAILFVLVSIIFVFTAWVTLIRGKRRDGRDVMLCMAWAVLVIRLMTGTLHSFGIPIYILPLFTGNFGIKMDSMCMTLLILGCTHDKVNRWVERICEKYEEKKQQ